MAMIDCPKCGHQVSTYADACPECGHPVNEKAAAEQAAPGPAAGGLDDLLSDFDHAGAPNAADKPQESGGKDIVVRCRGLNGGAVAATVYQLKGCGDDRKIEWGEDIVLNAKETQSLQVLEKSRGGMAVALGLIVFGVTWFVGAQIGNETEMLFFFLGIAAGMFTTSFISKNSSALTFQATPGHTYELFWEGDVPGTQLKVREVSDEKARKANTSSPK